MAADALAVILGPLDERISGVEVELSALGLRGLPLEAVLGRDLPEIFLEDGLLRLLPLVLEVLRLRRRPEVQLPLFPRISSWMLVCACRLSAAADADASKAAASGAGSGAAGDARGPRNSART